MYTAKYTKPCGIDGHSHTPQENDTCWQGLIEHIAAEDARSGEFDYGIYSRDSNHPHFEAAATELHP